MVPELSGRVARYAKSHPVELMNGPLVSLGSFSGEGQRETRSCRRQWKEWPKQVLRLGR
jgi:hypothetical protein